MSAADTATLVADALRRGEAHATTQLPAGEAVYAEALIRQSVEQALSGGRWGTTAVPPPPATARAAAIREIRYVATDAAVRRLWQQHRIVYDFDESLWAELGATDDDTVVPAGLMRGLPHPDPFVAFPHPLLLPLEQGAAQRVVGFFVTGRSSVLGVRGQVSTHAQAANGHLGLLICGLGESTSGRPIMVWPGVPDLILQRVTLDTGDGDVTVGQMIDSVLARFDRAPYAAGDVRTQLPLMIRQAVSALVYLCATNAELRPLPARPRKPAGKAAKGGAPKPPKVIRVGFDTGSALRAWHRSETTASPGGGGRRPVRPHVRRSHFHTFWAGPQRTEKRVKWLGPIPVNATGRDAERTTVVPVSALEEETR